MLITLWPAIKTALCRCCGYFPDLCQDAAGALLVAGAGEHCGAVLYFSLNNEPRTTDPGHNEEPRAQPAPAWLCLASCPAPL